MKKIIYLILHLLFIFSVTGCTTMHDDSNDIEKNNISHALVVPALQEKMQNSDNEKLMQLINTGKPHQKETWKNEDKNRVYEFTSLNIYVNEQGQACRTYRLRVASRWREYHMEGNACRMNDGSWLGNSKEVK